MKLSHLWSMLQNLSFPYNSRETSPKLHPYFLQNPVEDLSPVADLEGADEILSLIHSKILVRHVLLEKQISISPTPTAVCNVKLLWSCSPEVWVYELT